MNASNIRVIRGPVEHLRIHPVAQRQLAVIHVKRLMAKFDLDAVGILHGAEYERTNEQGGRTRAIWIIDGQTRVEAMRRLGLEKHLVAVAIHLDVKDDARACALFLELNYRSNVMPFDKFEKGWQAGYPDIVEIVNIAARKDLRVTRYKTGSHVLACVAALQKVFHYDQGVSLEAGLETLINAYGYDSAALEGRLIEGLGLLYKTFNGNIDRASLIKRLSKFRGGPSGILGVARSLHDLKRGSGTVARCVALAIMDAYNAGRTVNLLEKL